MNHTVASTLTKSAGAHSIRTGFEYRVYQQADQFKSNQQTGQFTFGSTWTRGPLDNSAASPGSIGQSVADAPARPAGFRQHHPPVRLHRAVRFLGHSSCRTIGRSPRS